MFAADKMAYELLGRYLRSLKHHCVPGIGGETLYARGCTAHSVQLYKQATDNLKYELRNANVVFASTTARSKLRYFIDEDV